VNVLSEYRRSAIRKIDSFNRTYNQQLAC